MSEPRYIVTWELARRLEAAGADMSQFLISDALHQLIQEPVARIASPLPIERRRVAQWKTERRGRR